MEQPIEPGEILDGKYAVEDVIGEGGMGCVYSARHVDLDTPVAVKVLRPDASDDSRHRFLREARAASRIDNEHVARVFDVGKLADGTPFMVMELLEGRDLDEMLDEEGPLPVATAVGYALQACAALTAAHKRGVVHRDVKPANLFVATRDHDEPCIKLLDFGISKMPSRAGEGDETLTLTGSCLGSPLFMSPEQLLSCRTVDGRSDLWSLGVSLFELLTCQGAFEGQTVAELYTAILRDCPRRLRDFRPEIPAALDAVIARCLQKEADRRVQSADELAELLRPFCPDGANESAPPVSVDPVIEWTEVPPARQSAWMATEIMDHPLRFTSCDDLREQCGPIEGSGDERPLSAAPDDSDEPPEIDQTPAATVRSVAFADDSHIPSSRRSRGRWQVASALVAAGLIAGGLLGAAGSAAFSWSPAQPPSPQPPPQIHAAPVLMVTAPAVAPSASADPSPLVYSTQLSESQRERLLQEVAAAELDLDQSEHERVLSRVHAVMRELGTLGVEPHKANSSIGARAQLLVGHIEAAKARELLQDEPATFSEARAWAKRLDMRVARAQVAYDRVITWGVRSFYRCGLVEMAALDRDVAPVFSAAAPSSAGPRRDWYVAEARRHLKRARVGLRTALNVQSETMLCVDAAQEALDQVQRDLNELTE